MTVVFLPSASVTSNGVATAFDALISVEIEAIAIKKKTATRRGNSMPVFVPEMQAYFLRRSLFIFILFFFIYTSSLP